jgi:cysteine desulfurase
MAMSVDPVIGMGAVRFSLGRGTTQDEVDAVIRELQRVLE